MDTNEKQAEETPPEEMEAPREPTRFQLFLRRALRRSVSVLLIFALGVVAIWFARVQPQNAELTQLRASQDEADARIAELEQRVESLLALEAENSALQAELDESQLHVTLLRVLAEVSTAQLALKDGRVETAEAALAETDDLLAELQDMVEESQVAAVEGMRDRLALVLEEIDDDAFAAENDLEVLRNSLLALEGSLFGE